MDINQINSDTERKTLFWVQETRKGNRTLFHLLLKNRRWITGVAHQGVCVLVLLSMWGPSCFLAFVRTCLESDKKKCRHVAVIDGVIHYGCNQIQNKKKCEKIEIRGVWLLFCSDSGKSFSILRSRQETQNDLSLLHTFIQWDCKLNRLGFRLYACVCVCSPLCCFAWCPAGRWWRWRPGWENWARLWEPAGFPPET